ncbi:MAG TPA: hypothetical protein VF772_11040, partial [Terriglobales bacterium]
MATSTARRLRSKAVIDTRYPLAAFPDSLGKSVIGWSEGAVEETSEKNHHRQKLRQLALTVGIYN